jgi:N-acetyl-anhydromuramyl-L-alanine amidase AmpD
VVHDAEFPEQVNSAERLQAMCATWDRRASWHYAVDCDTICQSVKDEHRAWTAGPGNDFGLHFEFAGTYRQTKADWFDPYSKAMLELAIPLFAFKCEQHAVPVRWLTVEQMYNNELGIVSHHTISLASRLAVERGKRIAPWWRGGWRRTTHIDPGPNFPHNWFCEQIDKRL